MSGASPPFEESAEDLYEHAPCGYVSALPDGTIARVNETFLSWTGYDREQLVGRRRFQDLLSPGGRIYHETHYAPLLRLQGAVREIAVELVCADGHQLPVLMNSVLRHDASGAPTVVRTTVFDARDRRAYERELQASRERERAAREDVERLQRLTARLAAERDARGVVAAVADELRAGLGAERVALLGPAEAAPAGAVGDLAADRPVGSLLLPLTAHGAPLGTLHVVFAEARTLGDRARGFLVACAAQCGQALDRARLLERTADAARDSELLADVGRAMEEAPDFAGRVRQLVDAIVPRLVEAAFVTSGAPGSTADLNEIALPLSAEGDVVGALVVRPHAGSPPPWRLLDALADRAGLALENGRLYDRERSVAHALQRSMLGATSASDPRYVTAALYLPAVDTLEVGGDWHDTITVSDDRVAIAVGDVVGRGLEAAAAMGQLRSATRALAVAGFGPAEVLAHLDRFVEQVPMGRMTTLAYADVELSTGRVRYACAGHPPPALLQPAGAPCLLWDGRTAPLGAYLKPRAPVEGSVTVEAGGRLLLYTDGLVERRNEGLAEQLDRLLVELERRRDAPLDAFVEGLAARMLQDEVRADDTCVLGLALVGRTVA